MKAFSLKSHLEPFHMDYLKKCRLFFSVLANLWKVSYIQTYSKITVVFVQLPVKTNCFQLHARANVKVD